MRTVRRAQKKLFHGEWFFELEYLHALIESSAIITWVVFWCSALISIMYTQLLEEVMLLINLINVVNFVIQIVKRTSVKRIVKWNTP